MWASMVPSPNGTSVMIWFIRTAWAGGGGLPGVLLADLLGLFEPLVGQECVLRHGGVPPASGCWAGGTLSRLHCACRKSRVRPARRPRGAPQGVGDGLLVGGHRVHDVPGHEGRQLVERHRDPTGAVEVGEVPDRARRRPSAMSVGSSSRIVPSAWPALTMRTMSLMCCCGALAEDVGEVAALDLEEREEVGVLGHEVHRHLGAAVEVDERRRLAGRARRPAPGAGSAGCCRPAP